MHYTLACEGFPPLTQLGRSPSDALGQCQPRAQWDGALTALGLGHARSVILSAGRATQYAVSPLEQLLWVH